MNWQLARSPTCGPVTPPFSLGSGCINDRLVKMRCLVFGQVFWCCRSRLVAYLVPRAAARQRIYANAASAAPTVSSFISTESSSRRRLHDPTSEGDGCDTLRLVAKCQDKELIDEVKDAIFIFRGLGFVCAFKKFMYTMITSLTWNSYFSGLCSFCYSYNYL